MRVVPGTTLRPRRSGGITADPGVGLVGLGSLTGLLGVAAVRRRRVAYTERVAQRSTEVQHYTRTIEHHADQVIRQAHVSYVPETTYESVPVTTRIKTTVTSIAHKVWGWITHPIKTIKTVWKNVTTWVLHPVTTLRKVVSWATHTVRRVWHTTEQATRTVVHTTYRSVQRFKTVTQKVAPKIWRGVQELPGKTATWAVTKAKQAATSTKTWIGREAARFAKNPLAYLTTAPGRLIRGQARLSLKGARGLLGYGRDLATSGPRLAKANLQATIAVTRLTKNRHNTKAQAQLADALVDALDAGLDLVDLVSWLLLLIPGAGEAAKIGITAAARSLKQLSKKEARQELRALIERLLADTAEHTKTRLAARDEHGSAPLPRRPHEPTAAKSIRPAVADDRLARALADDFRGGPHPIGDGSALDAARHTLETGELVGGSTHLEKAVEMRDRYARILRRGGLSPADQSVAQGRYDAYSSFVTKNHLDAMMRARRLR